MIFLSFKDKRSIFKSLKYELRKMEYLCYAESYKQRLKKINSNNSKHVKYQFKIYIIIENTLPMSRSRFYADKSPKFSS